MRMSRSRPFDFIMLIYFIDDAIYIYVVWSTWTYARKIIRELYRSIDGSFFFKSISIRFKTKSRKVLDDINF